MIRNKIIAGNWKMNGLQEDCITKINELKDLLKSKKDDNVEVVICPPFTLISNMVKCVENSIIKVGAQNCHSEKSGAYTGDISANMIKDAGCSYIILGHSERRVNYNETNEVVKNKVKACAESGLTAIVCIGETKEEKELGKTIEVVTKQLQESLPESLNSVNLIIAYEPIWAIGTGLIPTLEDIKIVHENIRNILADLFSKDEANKIQILYGGSLNAKNCDEILKIENVDGGLIGGASLVVKDFATIIASASK